MSILLALLLSCAHTPVPDQEAASYLYLYNCTQLLPVALPDGLELAEVDGGQDKPTQLSPLIAVAHRQLWLDGVPVSDVEAMRVALGDRDGDTVLLAVDGAVSLGELNPLLAMLRAAGKVDWLLVASPADALEAPDWVDAVYGAAVLSEIQGSPASMQEILDREFEPLEVRCGALKDARLAARDAPLEAQCRQTMASTEKVRSGCRKDAKQILTLFQVAYGQGPAVTHVRVTASATGRLVPLAETAIWSQALPRLAEFDGQEINPAVSALR